MPARLLRKEEGATDETPERSPVEGDNERGGVNSLASWGERGCDEKQSDPA